MSSGTFYKSGFFYRISHANTQNQTNAKFVEVFNASSDYWTFMHSSLISYSGLHCNSSFRTQLAMELNSTNYVQIGDEKKRSNDARKEIETNSANVLTRPSLSETKNERTGFGSIEHLALPTVFEGKITKEGKVSKHEKLSAIGKMFYWSLLAFSPEISASWTLLKGQSMFA